MPKWHFNKVAKHLFLRIPMEGCFCKAEAEAVNYYHEALCLGYCSSPRFASGKVSASLLNHARFCYL